MAESSCNETRVAGGGAWQIRVVMKHVLQVVEHGRFELCMSQLCVISVLPIAGGGAWQSQVVMKHVACGGAW